MLSCDVHGSPLSSPVSGGSSRRRRAAILKCRLVYDGTSVSSLIKPSIPNFWNSWLAFCQTLGRRRRRVKSLLHECH
jgi:hypothetical protein